MGKIKAITFDLWDTVFMDDTDEPKRKAAGRPSKPEERRSLVYDFCKKKKSIERELVDAVYNAVDASFNKVWKELHVTWTVAERIGIILKGLGCDLPQPELDELVRLHEEMELEFRPDFIPGVHDALKALSGKYTLGVISDTIFSPGRALRKLLEGEGLIDCFSGFIFSDEVGNSKPEPAVFNAAAREFGVDPEGIVHIGDREHNDIKGAHRVGARAILCTASRDRGSDNTEADAIFSDYRELPKIISDMDS